MKIFHLEPDASGVVPWPMLSATRKAVVTVGAFDGTHKGHQAVIRETVEIAKRENCSSVVIMFEPRPAFVHWYARENDGMDVPRDVFDFDALSSVDERLRVVDRLGVDYALIVHYTLAFSEKSFRFFIGQLVGKLGMRTLVLGADAQMGARREGDVKKIKTLAEATGVFELVVVGDQANGHTARTYVPNPIVPSAPAGRGEPADPLAGLSKAERKAWDKKHNAREVRVWSSTNVRYLLSQGRVREANEILGCPHGVEGTVVHGEERGRTIGFPTANVEEPIEGYLPVDGVYAGWLIDLGPAEDYEESQKAHHGSGASGAGAQSAQDANSANGAGETAPADGGMTGLAGQSAQEKPVSTSYNDGGAASRTAQHSPLRWPAAISIGTKPTFSDKTGRNERVLEAYAITDDWLDLYGHRVRVEFEQFLRPQVKFDSAEELKAELEKNVAETNRLTRP